MKKIDEVASYGLAKPEHTHEEDKPSAEAKVYKIVDYLMKWSYVKTSGEVSRLIADNDFAELLENL